MPAERSLHRVDWGLTPQGQTPSVSFGLASSLVAGPQAFVVARASLRSALIPLNPPFLMLADPHTSVRNVIACGGAEGDGRGGETCNGNDNKELGSWM